MLVTVNISFCKLVERLILREKNSATIFLFLSNPCENKHFKCLNNIELKSWDMLRESACRADKEN